MCFCVFIFDCIYLCKYSHQISQTADCVFFTYPTLLHSQAFKWTRGLECTPSVLCMSYCLQSVRELPKEHGRRRQRLVPGVPADYRSYSDRGEEEENALLNGANPSLSLVLKSLAASSLLEVGDKEKVQGPSNASSSIEGDCRITLLSLPCQRKEACLPQETLQLLPPRVGGHTRCHLTEGLDVLPRPGC